MNTIKVLAIVMALTGATGLIYGNSATESYSKSENEKSETADHSSYRTTLVIAALADVGGAGLLFLLIGLRRMRRNAWLRYY